MVTLFVIRDVLYRVAVLTAIQSTIQDVLRAPSLSASLHGLSGNESYWRAIGLGSYLPSPPALHLASISTGWIRPGGRFIDCAVLSQPGYAGHEFNFTGTLVAPAAFTAPITPTLPAFTCPPTSTPPPPPAPSSVTPTPVRPYKALIEFRRPPALVHHQVSNPLNLDDIFEFKILETPIDRYFIDLAWKLTAANCEASIGRAWSAVWIHMACVLVFWICTGTKRVRLALVDLVPEFVFPLAIELVTVGRATLEDEAVSAFWDFVLDLWLADLFSPVYEGTPVETAAVKEIPSVEQPESSEESDEDDMAAVEDLVQLAPVELSEDPMGAFVQESETIMSAEELKSNEEEMAAVEQLVQLVFDESESVEDYTSGEGSDSDEDMAAVEDMIEVETEEPADVQAPAPAVVKSMPIAESMQVAPPATEEVFVAAKPGALVVEEPTRPSLNKDAPTFVPRFVRTTVAEPPTVEKVNQTLDELISRMETGRFGGPRDTPLPALVTAPTATPTPPPTAPPAAPEPRRIRTFYAQRSPRPPRRK